MRRNGRPLMTTTRFRLEIFLISLAVILLEVSYTRVFSFKLVYYFTYLIIGLALLGLGAGGVAVAMSRRLRGMPVERLVARSALAAAAAVTVSYAAVALVQLNAFGMVQAMVDGSTGAALREALKLVLICLSLFAPFFAAGIAIAVIFSTQPERINQLYFADLLGAGLGCAMCVPLMEVIFPPGCVMLAGAIAGGAAVVCRGPGVRIRALAAALAGVLLIFAVVPTLLPDPVVDQIKTMSPQKQPQVEFSRWSPVFRVDVLKPTPEFARGRPFKTLVHDGIWGSLIQGFDGDAKSLVSYDTDVTSLPFAVLPPSPSVVIIGAAGGNEILASLRFHATPITAVELNPVTVSLLTEHFADFSGRLAEHPDVRLVHAEGRSFLMQHPERADLIWFVAPDSYAAQNAATAGAYVLSESYLYTVEMIVESLQHLTPHGLVCIQFGEINFERKPNRTTRYLATAREAFRRLDISDFASHVMVSTTQGFAYVTSTILLKGSPFSDQEVRRFTKATSAVAGGRVRFSALDHEPATPVASTVKLDDEQLRAWRARYPFDVSPVTDDAPFFWHFVPFRTALASKSDGPLRMEEGVGEQLLLVLLVVATALAAVFLLAPLLAGRALWRAIPCKLNAAVYFAALGLGFMFFEVTLIQRFTLFLGYPTYSLTVTLFALLVFTGYGSLLSERAVARRRLLLPLLLLALALLVGLYLFWLPQLMQRWVGAPLPVRISLAVAALAPLGLCLGAFMPLGLRTVAALTPHRGEYVAWAWAVNGFFSVVSSILATVLAMTYGFNAVLVVALCIYAVAVLALLPVSAPEAFPEQNQKAPRSLGYVQ